mgnify:CR=1 FL=1
MSQLLNVQLRRESDRRAWEQAESVVARELGIDPDDLTRAEAARELCEAYCGNNACGQWKNND